MRILDLAIFVLELLDQLLVVLQVMSHGIKNQRLMSFSMVDVCEPSNVPELHKTGSFVIHSCCKCSGAFWCNTEIGVSTGEPRSKPYDVFFQQRENLFIGNGILTSDNDELFVGCHNPCKKFPEQRERRVRDDDVSFITEFADLRRTEIAVTLKISGELDIVSVDFAGTVGISGQYEQLPVSRVLFGIIKRRIQFEQRRLLICSALGIRCRYQLLQSEALKVGCEILRKIRPLGIVAGKKNRLVPKNIGIELDIRIHLRLDVAVLCIELIVLRFFCN